MISRTHHGSGDDAGVFRRRQHGGHRPRLVGRWASDRTGRWEAAGQAVVAGKTYNKYQASFMWFQPQQPQAVVPNNPWSRFAGMAHPRFVMYFDPATPDIMIGALQTNPYCFGTFMFVVKRVQPK
jgi:hypothetical protein